MWEPGVTVIKGYRTQACRKSAVLVPQIRAGVIPGAWVVVLPWVLQWIHGFQ